MLLGREIQSPNGAVARFHGDKKQGLEDGKEDAVNALAARCRLQQKAQPPGSARWLADSGFTEQHRGMGPLEISSLGLLDLDQGPALPQILIRMA